MLSDFFIAILTFLKHFLSQGFTLYGPGGQRGRGSKFIVTVRKYFESVVMYFSAFHLQEEDSRQCVNSNYRSTEGPMSA